MSQVSQGIARGFVMVPAMGVMFWIAAFFLAGVYFYHADLEPEKPRISAVAETQAGTLRALKDEAIDNIGWVAGNSYGHPVWKEVKPYIGRGGTYYNILLGTMPSKDADPETEAMLSVARYRAAFDQGKVIPFNEGEAASRLKRVNQIVAEFNSLLAVMR